MIPSSSHNMRCGVCTGNLASQAIFTGECSHSFHLGCISSIAVPICPVCQSRWTHLPFNNNNNYNYNYNYPFQNRPFPIPTYTQIPQPPQFPLEPEPLEFCDDEPLPCSDSDSIPTPSLQKVSVKAVPEKPALAASQSTSQFTVLVGLKAPPLSADTRSSQRAPIDLVTVLDVSGSMYGAKLNLVKRAVHFVIDNLGPSDRLSIVSFADAARRLLPLRRMTERGREDAKLAVNSLFASGSTNIVQGLKKGVQVLEERRHKNPVTSIIFLSDGRDTCNSSYPFSKAPQYLHLLPPAIFPRDGLKETSIPVHSFGFGVDHDPITMHAISDASGGTFSFIESYEMVQDAFASCIGGLLSVVTQDLRLTLRSASHDVAIRSIPSGRYTSEITNQGSQGLVNIGDLYADEEKQFLINMSVLAVMNDDKSERKTSLLDIVCSYKDVVSKETVQIESELVEIRRPNSVSPEDMRVNLEVDRQRNRVRAAESIAEAQNMAEKGNLTEAQSLLEKRRSDLLGTASGQAGDGLCMYLEADMREAGRRMGSMQQYQREGRAYALAGMSSHFSQRATANGNVAFGGAYAGAASGAAFGAASGAAFGASGATFGAKSTAFGAPGGGFGATGGGFGGSGATFGGAIGGAFGGATAGGRFGGATLFGAPAPYSTPTMNNMVFKSQQLNNNQDDTKAEKKQGVS